MKSYRKELWFNVTTRRAFINITPQVEQCLRDSGIREGMALVNAMHITASVFINDDESGLHADYERFLEDLSRRAFLYFWEQADTKTGLVLDRSKTSGEPSDENHRTIASIASTGFGLTALCIAAERGWIDRARARERVATTLRFFAERATHEHGWFYHWMDATTGERRWQSEVSSIDTALLLGGVLAARGYYQRDAEIKRLATTIYERVDFRWMLAGHPTLLSHGWKPETGFLDSRWRDYSEETIAYLLAIGSPTHSNPKAAWYALRRDRLTYGGSP